MKDVYSFSRFTPQESSIESPLDAYKMLVVRYLSSTCHCLVPQKKIFFPQGPEGSERTSSRGDWPCTQPKLKVELLLEEDAGKQTFINWFKTSGNHCHSKLKIGHEGCVQFLAVPNASV